MAILHNETYLKYYQKKYAEVKTHQHTRAIVLTARKFIRLIYTIKSLKKRLHSHPTLLRYHFHMDY